MEGGVRGGGVGGCGDGAAEGQNQRENKDCGMGGPHALNLNLELVGSERGGWGQALRVDGKRKNPAE